MRFRNGFAIALLAVSWVILAASATQKLDDIESEQKTLGAKSKDPTASSDSESFINSDSRGSLNSKSKSTPGSTFSENRRKSREIAAPRSKVMPLSESVIIDESRQRKARSAEDDETRVVDTPSPLENSTRSDPDNTDFAREQVDGDNSRGNADDSEATTRDDNAETIVTDAPHTSEDSATDEGPTEAPAANESSESSSDAEQTTISSDSPSEENHNDIEADPTEATTVGVTENFENGDATTVSDDNSTVMSSTESSDVDTPQGTESTDDAEVSTNKEEEVPATESPAVEETTVMEVSTEDELNLDSVEDGDSTTVAATEIPKDYTTDSVETTTEGAISTETTIISTTTATSKPNEDSKKKYNYFVYDDKSDIPCTLANMTINLKVTYRTKHNRAVISEFPVPEAANASGACGKKQSDLTLSWPSYSSASSEESGENRITFQIMNDGAFFYVSNVKANITLDSEDYSNAAEATLVGDSAKDLRLFSAPLKNGLHVCSGMTEISCGQIVVQIKDVSLIAYNDRKDHSDREQEVCQPSKTVSLAAVLGGLVAIAVTIGIVGSYVWYRKRANTFRSELP